MNSSEKLLILHQKAKEYQTLGLRKGQSYVNALTDMDFHFAGILNGTQYDCFYTDANLEEFLNKVLDHWNIEDEVKKEMEEDIL
jgi:hypothetical protein